MNFLNNGNKFQNGKLTFEFLQILFPKCLHICMRTTFIERNPMAQKSFQLNIVWKRYGASKFMNGFTFFHPNYGWKHYTGWKMNYIYMFGKPEKMKIK
jgi:hypothetical protein